MDQFLVIVKDYALLSGAGVVVLTGFGWLLRRAFTKPSIQQTQIVGPGGKGYQAGEDVTVLGHKDDR